MDDASRDLLRYLTREPAPRPWLVCVTRRPQGGELRTASVDGHVQLALGPLDGDAAQRSRSRPPASSRSPTRRWRRSSSAPAATRSSCASSSRRRGRRRPRTRCRSRVETLITDADRHARARGPLPAALRVRARAALRARAAGRDPRRRARRRGRPRALGAAGRVRRLGRRRASCASCTTSSARPRTRGCRSGGAARSTPRRRGARARAGDAAAEPRLLSLHFLEAEDYERAWRYSVARRAPGAGESRQRRRGRAVRARARGRAKSSTLPGRGRRGRRGARRRLRARGALRDARRPRTSARAISSPTTDRAARLLRKEGVLRERLRQVPRGARWYGRRSRARRAEDGRSRRTRADLELAYAGVKYRQGQFDEARRVGESAPGIAEAGGDRVELAHAYYLAAHRAHRLRQARQLAPRRGAGDPRGGRRPRAAARACRTTSASRPTTTGAGTRRSSGTGGAARRAARAGDVVNVARAQNNEGEILSDQGHSTRRDALFEEALPRLAGGAVPGRRSRSPRPTSAALPLARARSTRRTRCSTRRSRSSRRSARRRSSLETRSAPGRVPRLRGPPPGGAGATPSRCSQTGPPDSARRSSGWRATPWSRPRAVRRAPSRTSSERSRRASAAHAQYELALTLRAIAETSGGGDDEEADAILDQLGVVKTVAVPLP